MKMFEKGFHGLTLWTAEYMGEIPQAPLCENYVKRLSPLRFLVIGRLMHHSFLAKSLHFMGNLEKIPL